MSFCRLLCHIGHICAVALELSLSQPDLQLQDQNLVAETLLTALEVGHILLDLRADSSARRDTKMQSFKDFMEAGGTFIHQVADPYL